MSNGKVGNAGALGLCAFGLTTILLMLHNNGFFPLGSMIIAMACFYGGMVQVIVGILEWKHGNTFGTVAFTSFGAYWLSFGFIVILPYFGFPAATSEAMASFLLVWAVFTFAMFIGTLRICRALQVVFGLGTIGFTLLGIGDAVGSQAILDVAAVVGIALGASALYTGLAEVLNEVYGKVVLPIFPVKAPRTQREILSEIATESD